MANKFYKPTWEELRGNSILTPFGSSYVLKAEYLKNYLNYLHENGVHFQIPTRLYGKQYITETDYAEILTLVEENLVFSFTPGEDDNIRRNAINSFKPRK